MTPDHQIDLRGGLSRLPLTAGHSLAVLPRDQSLDLRDEPRANAADRPATPDTADQLDSDRDRTAEDRDNTSEAHDETSAARDQRADERDKRADARDETAANLDADAVSDRAGAKRDRQEGATDRMHAQDDREAAATDRALSARDRAVSLVDELTGAHRRDAGILELERETARAKRTGQSFVLAFIDVDGLKATNDSLGHAAGDELLRAVVESVRRHMRSYDLVVRFGGDEFLCGLLDLTVDEATKRFALVNDDLGQNRGASVTIGLAELRASDRLEDLIKRADTALYAQRGQRADAPVGSRLRADT